MRQSIEKQQETKSSRAAVTVMCHDRKQVWGGIELARARESAASSLSEPLEVRFDFVSDALPQPGRLRSVPRLHQLRCRLRRRSLPITEKFPAEGAMARSALAVLAADLNARSPQAVATVITPMTEQRRCFAA